MELVGLGWLGVRDSTIVKIVAIVSLAAIAIVALHHGIDHALTAGISAIIGGIAGYEVRGVRGAQG